MTSSPELVSKASELRRAGASVEQIADTLHQGVDEVVALLDAAAEAKRAEAGFDVALELDRLDRLHMAAWPKASRGDVQSIDRVLKISERREALAGPPKEVDHSVRDAFDRSVESSSHLDVDVDAALVESGRRIADRIDVATSTGVGQEVTKALYLVPHMMNVLREMGATPKARSELGIPSAPTAGSTDGKPTGLSKLRAV